MSCAIICCSDAVCSACFWTVCTSDAIFSFSATLSISIDWIFSSRAWVASAVVLVCPFGLLIDWLYLPSAPPFPLVDPYVTAETGDGLRRISANVGGFGLVLLCLLLASAALLGNVSKVNTDIAFVNAVAYESLLLDPLLPSPVAADVMIIGGCDSGMDAFALSDNCVVSVVHCLLNHWRVALNCFWATSIFQRPLSCPL